MPLSVPGLNGICNAAQLSVLVYKISDRWVKKRHCKCRLARGYHQISFLLLNSQAVNHGLHF
jgi:hypothetical protein